MLACARDRRGRARSVPASARWPSGSIRFSNKQKRGSVPLRSGGSEEVGLLFRSEPSVGIGRGPVMSSRLCPHLRAATSCNARRACSSAPEWKTKADKASNVQAGRLYLCICPTCVQVGQTASRMSIFLCSQCSVLRAQTGQTHWTAHAYWHEPDGVQVRVAL